MISLRHFEESDAEVLQTYNLSGKSKDDVISMIHDWNTLSYKDRYFEDYTDDDGNARKMGEFIRELGDAVERVELLPYHEMGKHKWAFFNDPYQLNDIHPPKADTMNRLKNILKEYHNEVY